MQEFSIKLEGVKQGSTGKQSWVYSLPVDQEIWNGERLISFSMADLKQLQQEFVKINAEFKSIALSNDETPYRFPVKINHNRGSGESFGEIVDVKTVEGKGLYLSVVWNDTTWEEIQKDNYKYVSVGIKPSYTTQLGNTYGPLIVELSLTEYPRVQSIGKIKDTLELRLSNIEDFEMNEEAMKAIEAFLMEKMQMLKEEIKAEMKAEMAEVEVEVKDEEEVPVEEAPEAPEMEGEAPAPEDAPMDAPEEDKKEEEELSNDVEEVNPLEERIKALEEKIGNFANFKHEEKAPVGKLVNKPMTFKDTLDKLMAEGYSHADATAKALKMCK